MTIDEARDLLLAKGGDAAVIYRPTGEDGVITRVSGTWVFVRYGDGPGSQATDAADLELPASPLDLTERRRQWRASLRGDAD